MHDIDPMRNQFEEETDSFETEGFEYDFEAEGGMYEEVGADSPFHEADELDLATELLSVTEEAELDQFLGKLLRKASRGIRRVAGGALGPLGGMLKGIAKKALPFVGGALGSIVPGAGTALGTALGSAVSGALEVDMEGLNQDEQEFDMARRFVRLAGGAARKAGLLPPGFDPRAAARSALATAARQYAPGLLSLLGEAGAAPPPRMGGAAPAAPMRPGQSGKWVRRGRKIILFGV